ncbi:DUF4446 family protein [Tissierella creatinini]|nr:DUF4446 family protein [Tissierella creatinini]TJX61914.1 DUF4446 family protein [Soehngenia saccharolytica]
MDYLRNFISIYNAEILMGLIILVLGLIITTIYLSFKVKKVKERYDLFVKNLDGLDVEGLFIKANGEIMDIKRDLNLFEQNISQLETRLMFTIQRVGFIRYNAFQNVGSDLSFSIAIMDHYQNGFILTSIYGRENNVCYAKPLKNGESSIPLSKEELMAIDKALKGDGLFNEVL